MTPATEQCLGQVIRVRKVGSCTEGTADYSAKKQERNEAFSSNLDSPGLGIQGERPQTQVFWKIYTLLVTGGL